MTSSTSRPVQTGPGRRRSLAPSDVVDAAVQLLDSEGATGLSIRAVAARLGVNPNAVYTYVTDRAALEQEVVERVLSEADTESLAGPVRSWRRRISRYATSLREALLSHPGAVHLFMTAPMTGPTALAVGEGLLDALIDAGVSPRDAARGTYPLIIYVLGSVALEVAETDGRLPMAAEAERIAQRRLGLEVVPSVVFPRTAAATNTMAQWIGGPQFEWGLARLLDGLTRAEA
ncbi:MAG: TetR/AcrR family transcriptional regulator [Aeromicrobium sp.]